MTHPLTPTFDQARDDLSPLLTQLMPAYKHAVDEARDYKDLKEHWDGSFFSHHVRYLGKVYLKRHGVNAEDCEIEDTANSGLCIVGPDYKVRILKSANGEIPDPGDSERRKRFLAQAPEQLYLFSNESGEREHEPEPVHIVLLWELDHHKNFTGFWLTCPKGIGAYHFKEWVPVPSELPDLLRPSTIADDLEGITKRSSGIELARTGTDSKG